MNDDNFIDIPFTGSSKKNLAKFSDSCSIRADGLCIGSPRLVGGRKAGYSNMQDFFLHQAVIYECA